MTNRPNLKKYIYMKHVQQKKRRRSIRILGYDYSQAGAYYVTICTNNREILFGEILNEEMKINENGSIVTDCWRGLQEHYSHMSTDTMIVMPNHLHGILINNNDDCSSEKQGGSRTALLKA